MSRLVTSSLLQWEFRSFNRKTHNIFSSRRKLDATNNTRGGDVGGVAGGSGVGAGGSGGSAGGGGVDGTAQENGHR